MTSKQALDKLCEFGDLYENEECRKVIEKDLEVLETIKQVFNYETIDEFMDNLTTNQFYEIKEWLEQ